MNEELANVLDQRDTGRLQRLDKAACQPDGDAVADPHAATLACPDRDVTGLNAVVRAQEGTKFGLGPIRVHVGRGVDVSVPRAAEKGNLPDPAGFAGSRAGIGRQVAAAGRLAGNVERDCPVAPQLPAERLERLAERAVDEQSAKAAAVEEQVGVQRAVPLRLHMADPAIGTQSDSGDVIDHMSHASRDGVHLEQLRESSRLNMLALDRHVAGIGWASRRLGREAGGCDVPDALPERSVDREIIACGRLPQPVVDQYRWPGDRAERMPVVAVWVPAAEADAEFEDRVGG